MKARFVSSLHGSLLLSLIALPGVQAQSVWTGSTDSVFSTGSNFNPAIANTAVSNLNVRFDGSDPTTEDLTLALAFGGGAGGAGSIYTVLSTQTNPLTITGSASAAMRFSTGLSVEAGAGAVTLAGTGNIAIGGLATASSHAIRNLSSNLLDLGNWLVISGGGNARTLTVEAGGDIRSLGNWSNSVSPLPSTNPLSLDKTGAGKLTLGGTNSVTGNTLVSAGTLELTNALALQNSALDTSGAGTVTVVGPTTLITGGLTGGVNLASILTTGYSGITELTLNPRSGTQTYSGTIADGAPGMNLVKSGAGTQVLAGANSYTGTTTVNGGSLRLGSADALGTTTKVIVNGAGGAIGAAIGSLDLAGISPATAIPLELNSGAGNITVASNIVPATPSRMSLTKSGTGTLVLSGSNTFSGGTTIHEGKIIATTSTALGAGAVVNHGTLDLTAGAVTYSGLSSSLSGNGEVNVTLGAGSATTLLNGNYSNFTGTWNLGIGAATGAGKVQMNGLDHPSATIRVLENATLYTTSGNHQADLVLYGGNTGESLGQLRIEGSATWAGDITLAGPITGTGDGHIGANSGTGIISGNIGETGGPRSLVKEGDGTIVLTGTNTFTGPAAVNDGILLVDSPGSLAGAVTVASGATFGGSGTVAGGITVDAGGTLDPGRTGPVTLTVQGPFSLAGTTQFRADRSGSPICGRIHSTGSIAFGGTLKVINEGPALKLGDQLQLFTAASLSGTFSSLLLPPLGYDLMWDTSTLATNGTLRVASAASQDHPVITLTPGTFHQQMFGIGGNFCQGEQGTLVGYNRFDEMFGADGLNMSFIRLSTAHELAEPGFASFDANNVTTIQQFRARQPNGRVMLTTWTPPESLKSTNSPYQGTLAKTAGGQYRYTDYAAWWTRALQFYQNNGVLPDYVSIQNECDFTPTPPASGPIAAYLAGCYLNATETSTRAGYPQALAAVRSAFANAGLGSMKMIGPDTTAIAGDKVKNYLDNIPSGQIDAIAHHLYHDSPGSTGIADLFVNANNWRVAASSNDPDIALTHYRHYGGPGISDRQIIVMINQSAEVKHTTVGTSASWSPNSAQRFWQVHQTANDGSVSKRLTMTGIDQGPWLSGDRQLVLPPYSITPA